MSYFQPILWAIIAFFCWATFFLNLRAYLDSRRKLKELDAETRRHRVAAIEAALIELPEEERHGRG